jgi:hypothetical protein
MRTLFISVCAFSMTLLFVAGAHAQPPTTLWFRGPDNFRPGQSVDLAYQTRGLGTQFLVEVFWLPFSDAVDVELGKARLDDSLVDRLELVAWSRGLMRDGM